MRIPIDLALQGASYVRSNPLFLLSAAKNAAGLGVTIPLDLLRWLVERRPAGKGPERIDISASPPGIAVGLTVDLYGTKLDVSTHIEVESIENTGDELRVTTRVTDLRVDAPPGTPAAMMLQSFDLSRPGNLINMMPKRPAALVEADGDRFVFDLMKIRKLRDNRLLRRALTGLADVVRVKDVRTDGDLLVVGFGVDPFALPTAMTRLRSSS